MSEEPDSCTLIDDPKNPGFLTCTEWHGPTPYLIARDSLHHAGDPCPLCEVEGKVIFDLLKTDPPKSTIKGFLLPRRKDPTPPA